MATRVCPKCGSQYVASVRRCIDCDVILVEEVDPKTDETKPTSAATPVNDGDEVAYELEGWSNQLKLSLEGMLDRAGIRRVWEAAVLLVPAEFEEQVDSLIATVEGVDLDDFDDEEERVAFDVQVLTAEELEDLDARLYAAGVAHAWTEDLELLVRDEVAEQVESVIEEILSGEAGAGADDEDGFDLQARLSGLYVAVDKLVKNPLEAKPVSRFLAAAEGIDGHGVPYGLSGDEWASFLSSLEELRTVVQSSPDDDLAEVDAAHEARDDDGEVMDEEEQDEVEALLEESDAEDDGEPVVDRHGLARDLAMELRERLRDLV